jgi:preprotein translocase subunit YajC
MFTTKAYASDTTVVSTKVSEELPKAPEPFYSGWTSMIPMVLIFVVFYFLLIRPQEKRRRLQEDLVKGVKKGEEILTNSGIFGIITKINDSDNTVEVEIAKDTEVKILKSAIVNIISRKKEEKSNKGKKSISSAKAS